MNVCQLMVYLLLSGAAAGAADAPPVSPARSEVVRVATALEHLTVLEFGEPVTMVASGSAGFQIARQDDKVLVKPLESGVSTDLFVWTASRRFIYELQAPGEVKEMNFVVDNRTPPILPPATQKAEEGIDPTARAFLAARPIDSAAVRDRKGEVTVRIEHVLLSKNRLYLHYSVRNLGKRSYPLETPAAELRLTRPGGLPRPMTQLEARSMKKAAHAAERKLDVAGVYGASGQLRPGETAECVIVLDRVVDSAVVLELTFASDGAHPVRAAVVL